MDAPSPTRPAACCDHAVQLYESDELLARSVASFLAAGLRAGDAAIVIATTQHHRALLDELAAAGVDAADPVRDGRLVTLDAASTLRRFMTPAGPDPERFAATIGAVLDRAAEEGRAVRAFGEMVAVLWEDGDVASAMELEQLWNDLAAERDFSLLCAYPRALFNDASAQLDFERMCARHTRVLPGEPAMSATPSGGPVALRSARAPESPAPARARTLGPCAQCGDPVSHADQFVRLYRRAWHLECALEAGGTPRSGT